ncbi:MAG TPA: maltotransferase domain-containing protein [Alphaproteobacteria bacterium]|nr:maltotransferase domain-containing protein [Alphaproteobacteria bacterium]
MQQDPGPRIYNLFPLLAGTIADWQRHLPRIAALGFDWVYVNPFHYPGFSGSLYAVKDYYRLNPIFVENSSKKPETLLREFTDAAAVQGLGVMMDLVINHTARDSPLVEQHPHWYLLDALGEVRSPSAIDPADARNITVWGDLAEIDYRDRPERTRIVQYWQELVRRHVALGFRGFRCDAAYKVPAEVWNELIAAGREEDGDLLFAAETLGCRLEEVRDLQAAGFDYLFNSAKWWDFRSDWLLEQYDSHRAIAPSIAFPESHDTDRLATELKRQGVKDKDLIERGYRQRYLFAAAFSSGVLMPMGFEFGFRRKLDVVETRPDWWEEKLFDLSDFIAEANRGKAATPALNIEGPQKRITSSSERVVGLLRQTGKADGGAWALTLVNSDLDRPRELRRSALGVAEADLASAIEVTPGRLGRRLADGGSVMLDAGEVRILAGGLRTPVSDAPIAKPGPAVLRLAQEHPVIIENVKPEIDCGRHPVKREVGDMLEVEATIFKEGHDRIAAALMLRVSGEKEWREYPMRLVSPGLDLWVAAAPLERNMRYRYTIEAWPDEFESWREALEKKRDAGQRVEVELLEGRSLLAATMERAPQPDRLKLRSQIEQFDEAEEEARARLLLDEEIRKLMRRNPDRSHASRYRRELEAIVDRPAARFAAWYEIFPRSQGGEPGRSATFRDVIRRLPEIQAMGFDVLYLTPIHPIGRTHRKGPNNSLNPGPHDPGSPYAIGSSEGGHKTVHPELGTLEDFRALVAAATRHGLEIALDFAIQCSPDHPWIREHPEWFQFRPDGSIKYAENPPKKYQDIVNVNFYGPHQEALWRELRDTVLFWIEQGVKTFRVDNPHTKPIPFWEWLIGDIQARHPDVIFLSEAFTRPPMLKKLAKLGFTQSYTYFTWRNFKQEVTDYLTELTQSEVKEYLRPNFFANTPDILPLFLQQGGRPAFKIRLVLAATLSSVYGIYSGFELCENRAVPGKEEYDRSEKYEYKVWDWNRPDNIKEMVAAINHIRRENPALQEFENLRFHPASDDNVLFYGKMSFDRDNIILIAVNLDPFEPHESRLELPLSEMGIGEEDSFEVEELLTGSKHLWRGSSQSVRLDTEAPAAIFRVRRWVRIDFESPCF